MYRTIFLGSAVSIQGLFMRNLSGGRIAIRVGNRVYSGIPAEAA